MIRITDLFTTPLADVTLPDHEPVCEELRQLFLEREKEGDAHRYHKRRETQFGDLFESKFDLFTWKDPCVVKIARFCHGALGELIRQLSNYSSEELTKLRFDYHAWFHVTRTGGFQGLHNHQNASWSGIFCVDPGDELPDRPDSGLVRFHDPRWCSWYHSEKGNLGLNDPYRHGGFDVTHRPGRLVIFPSFLTHEIFPYLGERPRIVIAFNCSIT
jgi:uncharacterized protein (TIGR02466 family)